MIINKFISDCLDMIKVGTDGFDQVTDNPGTSVPPSWLAEDVKSSLCLLCRLSSLLSVSQSVTHFSQLARLTKLQSFDLLSCVEFSVCLLLHACDHT